MSISRAGLIDWILIDLVNHVSARMVVGFGNGIYVKAIFRSDMFRVVLGADEIGKRNEYLRVGFEVVRRLAKKPA